MKDSVDTLRKRAEELLASSSTPSTVQMRTEETLSLIYELNVHQAELEMQNDELRRTQQDLIESKDQLSELFELAPVSYLTVDSGGIITEANSRSEELFEADRSQIVGSALASYCTSESADRLFLCLRKGRQDDQRITCQLKLRQGLKARDIRLDGVKAKNDDQQPGMLRIVVTDITEQKRAATIQAEHLHAVQREKISTLGIVAGGVAHDFNNLLTPITLHAELAAQDDSLPPATKKNLKCIVDAAENAAGICKTLLELSGDNQFALLPISISGLVRDQIEFITASLPPHLKLVYKHDAMPTNILGDPNKIQRVLTNLISNSVEAVGDFLGTITVETSTKYFTKAELSRMSFATNTNAGRFACISINDNGSGMSKETITRVFEAFYSTKLTGRGLGMSSVIGIIRDHGAAIDVASCKDSGTTILSLFPTTERDLEPTENHSTPVSTGSGMVLVVDDNSLVRESFIHLLDFSGFSTLEAASGAKAIELVKNGDNSIDLVLLDLRMPGMNGVETLIAIREFAPNMPVVIATGYAEDEMLETINSHEIQGFVTKPCSIGVLSNVIKLALHPESTNRHWKAHFDERVFGMKNSL